MEKQYTAVYERHGRWYAAYVEEVPGANTQGRTLKEARENLQEALRLVLEANRDLAAREQSGAAVRREPIAIDI